MDSERLSRVTAGSKRHANFVKQLQRNNIIRMSKFRLKVHRMDGTFTDKVRLPSKEAGNRGDSIGLTTSTDYKALLEIAIKLPGSHLSKVKEVLNIMAVFWDRGKYNDNEWTFHYMMHGRLQTIIEPEACDPRVPEHALGWGDYEFTRPGEWDFTSKVISDRCKDLSRPKVDDCFSLSMDQDKTDQDTPLFRICRRVELRAYRSENMAGRGEDVSFERAVELLSTTALKRFNAHNRLKDVSEQPRSTSTLHAH
jgi:hypothetical protein